MRVYLAADRAALEALRAGESLTLQPFVADSDDEMDEFAAMSAAAEAGAVVVAADVDGVMDGEFVPLTLDRIASFHLDVDGTGDLAWYGTQELEQVLDLLGA